MDQKRDVPQFVMEYTTAEQLGIDPANASVHPVVECMAILMSNSLEPARTSLVVTGDFVASVKARLEPGDYRDGYHTERNSGIVTGKTMTMPDGTIDVVLPSILFEPGDKPEMMLFRTFTAQRAVLHEAQHVAMEQAAEARQPGSFIGPRIGWANLRSSANQVIDEYRAEAAVFSQWPELQLEWNAQEVLSTWADRVIQAAFVDYQRDLDLSACWQRVASVNLNAWTQLGYLAGALAGGDFPDIAGAWRQHPLWPHLVAPHWPEFLAILSSVPHARVRLDRADIDLAVDTLAELFSRWFMTLGFELVDDEAGGFAFYLLRDGAVQEVMRQAPAGVWG